MNQTLSMLFTNPFQAVHGVSDAADAAPRAVEVDVEAAQKGDVAAFERLYRANAGRVYALCMRLCGDRGHAEQMTQDTFVHAWERLRTFRAESSFATWLRHVAVSVVLTERRARARRERRVMPTEDEEMQAASAPPRRDDEGIDLERAIAALPEGARTVLVLHDIEGYQHDEIARMAGIAEGTSKAHLHRARTILKGVLR